MEMDLISSPVTYVPSLVIMCHPRNKNLNFLQSLFKPKFIDIHVHLSLYYIVIITAIKKCKLHTFLKFVSHSERIYQIISNMAAILAILPFTALS